MIENNEQSRFNVDEDGYRRDMAELQSLRERYETEEALNTTKDRKEEEMLRQVKTDRKNNQMLMSISWIMFILALVPLLPYKTIISAAGVITGYLHMKDDKGNSKAPFIANTVLLVLRVIFWILILIFPLFFWWPMLLS